MKGWKWDIPKNVEHVVHMNYLEFDAGFKQKGVLNNLGLSHKTVTFPLWLTMYVVAYEKSTNTENFY